MGIRHMGIRHMGMKDLLAAAGSGHSMARRSVFRGAAVGAALFALAATVTPGLTQQLRGSQETARPATAPPPDDPGRYRKPRHDTPMPGGKLVRGARNISAAWFSAPVQRYRHFALGSEFEPETLTVSMSDRRFFRLTMPDDSVFEDRMPRLADVDGDGNDEVIVVRAYLKSGAALAIAAVRDNALKIIAETPPIGRAFRWLNPAGVGDFDGDGKADIALVRTPHIAGELQIWTLVGGKLVLKYDTDDVSNHVAGSPHLALSAVADFNGDGIVDLALPSFDRRSLRFLTAKGGKLREFARVQLTGSAAEDFRLVAKDGRPAVLVGFAGGRTAVVQP
jgi:hypothetical protein